MRARVEAREVYRKQLPRLHLHSKTLCSFPQTELSRPLLRPAIKYYTYRNVYLKIGKKSEQTYLYEHFASCQKLSREKGFLGEPVRFRATEDNDRYVRNGFCEIRLRANDA